VRISRSCHSGSKQSGHPGLPVDIPCNEPGVKIATQIATDNYGGGKEAARPLSKLGEAGAGGDPAFQTSRVVPCA
jgi:hypothetical protein